MRVRSRAVPQDPEDRAMSISGIRALHPRLAASGYDIVHIQTPFIAHYAGLAIAQKLGLPCVESYHTFFEEYLFHYVPWVPKSWMRLLARSVSRAQGNSVAALVVPSNAMHEALLRYGVNSQMRVIPTGISPGDFSGGDGARFRSRLGIPPEAVLQLFVGRVAFEKNIAFLLRAFSLAIRSVPDLMLVVAGEGPAETQLKRLAQELGLDRNIRFVGYLDRGGDLLDCYRAADAFVFASRTETQGLVLLEAMAMGLPVISTAIMGTASIVGARRGALVPEDNENDFATAMVRLAQDPALRQDLARDARTYAAEWSAGAMATNLSKLYAEVIGTRRPGYPPVNIIPAAKP
jgi:glycosyltransferase involved in cell wall biosynthesis